MGYAILQQCFQLCRSLLSRLTRWLVPVLHICARTMNCGWSALAASCPFTNLLPCWTQSANGLRWKNATRFESRGCILNTHKRCRNVELRLDQENSPLMHTRQELHTSLPIRSARRKRSLKTSSMGKIRQVVGLNNVLIRKQHQQIPTHIHKPCCAAHHSRQKAPLLLRKYEWITILNWWGAKSSVYHWFQHGKYSQLTQLLHLLYTWIKMRHLRYWMRRFASQNVPHSVQVNAVLPTCFEIITCSIFSHPQLGYHVDWVTC